MELYLNGVLVGGPNLGVPFQNSGPLEIGFDAYSQPPSWDGAIDDVAFYDKVLSAGQIQAQYASAVFSGTLIDRDNTSDGNYGIELDGATNVTISNLSVANAVAGIYADEGSSSQRL